MPGHSRKEKFDSFPTIYSNKEDNASNDELQTALEAFYYDIAEIPKERVRVAQKSLSRMLETVMPRLRRNRFGFRYTTPILSDPLFSNLKTIDIDTVEIIIPLVVSRTLWENHPEHPGYVRLPLPEVKKDMLLGGNPWRHFKSRDSKYLSPMQVAVVTWALLRDCLMLPWPVKGYDMQPLKFKTEGFVIYLTDTEINMTVRVIIGLKFDEKEPCNLYTKPFEDDIDPRSDEYWRLTYIEKELLILKAIEPADRFRRVQAVKTLCALTKLDPIFQALNDYEILTVMFHLCDEELDSKIWHKKTLRECFLLILNKLLDFLKKGSLPHLYITEMDLFRNMKLSDRKLLIGRVNFMILNEKEVMRVCRRRAANYRAKQEQDSELLSHSFESLPVVKDDFYEASEEDLETQY